jgi:uncharacterized protein
MDDRGVHHDGRRAAVTPTQVVQHYFDTFFGHDIDKTLECLTEDVLWRVQGAADVPTIGTRHGRAEVREWLELFPEHFHPVSFEIQRTFESGDQVVLVGEFTHRIIDTGKEFGSDFAAICTVRDGKLAAYNFLEDSFGLWQAFQPTA